MIQALLLVGLFGVMPLAAGFLPSTPLRKIFLLLQPFAAAAAAISFAFAPGTPAAALAVPWAALTGLLAVQGLLRLKTVLGDGLPAFLVTCGLGFIPVGGVHLVASRAGHPLGGFPEPIVLLTAVHFHYTAFAAPVLASLTIASLRVPAARLAGSLAGLGLVAGTPLLAAGFLFLPSLKLTAVALLVASLAVLATFQLLEAFRLEGSARVLLAISALSILAGMALAMVYEVGVYTSRGGLSIPRMAHTHGLLNGVGFALLGLIGRRISGSRVR